MTFTAAETERLTRFYREHEERFVLCLGNGFEIGYVAQADAYAVAVQCRKTPSCFVKAIWVRRDDGTPARSQP